MWRGRGMVSARMDFLDATVAFEWPLLRRVLAYFRPYLPHSLVALTTIVAGSALGLVPALVTKTLIDRVLRPGVSFRMVAAGIISISFCMRRAYFWLKYCTSKGMSSGRSRKGGTRMGKTFSR